MTVDVEALRQAPDLVNVQTFLPIFERLSSRVEGPEGDELRQRLAQDPLGVLEDEGLDLTAVQASPEARDLLAELLPAAAAVGPERTSFVLSEEPVTAASSIGCYACVKSTEAAISIGAGASLGLLFAGGSVAVAALGPVSAVVAGILSISLAAARQLLLAILSKVSSPGQLVNELARKACKKPCR